MTWVKLDDGFASHPKMVAAGPLGLAMQVAGLCYCNRYLTDGFVPRAVPSTLLHLDELAFVASGNGAGSGCDADADMIVEDLVQAGVWETADGGWLIHDYASYQPSKAEVLAAREKDRQRHLKMRKSRHDSARNPEGVRTESWDPRSRRELLRSSLEERQPKTAAAVPLPDPACHICGIQKPTQKLLDEHLENVHGQAS